MTNSLKKYFNVKLTAPEKMVKRSSHADHPYFNDVAVSKPLLETVGEICLWRFALGRWNTTARCLNLFSITSEHLPANCKNCWIEVLGTLLSMFDRCCKPL